MNNMSNNRNYNPNNNFRNNQGRSNNGYNRQDAERGVNYAQKFANRNKIQEDNNKINSKYGSMCNTVQKKFNMTLYQGQEKANGTKKSGNKYRIENNCRANQNRNRNRSDSINRENGNRPNNNNRVNNRFNVIDSKSSLDKNKRDRVQFNRNFNREGDKKERKTAPKEYSEIENISTQLEEETNALPKSVFVYITVALAFVAVLIFIVAKGGTPGSKINKVDNSKIQEQAQEDKGLNFDIQGDIEASQFEQEEVEQEVNTEDNNLQSANLESERPSTTSTNSVISSNMTSSNKPSTSTNTSTNNSTSNKTNTSTNTSTNKKPANNKNNNSVTNNSDADEETTDEEVAEEENVQMTYIPMKVTGMLYHCSGFYGSYGASGGFQKYTKYQELGNGIRVQSKDINGIWIDVRGMKVIDYVGYKAGVKTNVMRIELENSDSTSCGTIYALKGTFITLGGTYRKKTGTTTFTSVLANEDMELVKVGS